MFGDTGGVSILSSFSAFFNDEGFEFGTWRLSKECTCDMLNKNSGCAKNSSSPAVSALFVLSVPF